MPPELLSVEEIDEALLTLDGWEIVDDSIKREIEFEGFMDAIDFINRIAVYADEFDHHPEIYNVYNTVALTLSTHDAGGLTQKDFDLASRIDTEA